MFIIIGVLLIVSSLFIISSNKSAYGYMVSGAFIALGFVLLVVGFQKPTPSAIDVYRDKTTLEITYRDGIPIDSVVVFKIK